MTVDQIDFFLVHWGGLLYDLFVGFIFFFDKTRPLAFIFCSAFNGMNSQMFSIGKSVYHINERQDATVGSLGRPIEN